MTLHELEHPLSAVGTKRICYSRSAMSAFGGKADIASKLLARKEARREHHFHSTGALTITAGTCERPARRLTETRAQPSRTDHGGPPRLMMIGGSATPSRIASRMCDTRGCAHQ